jgi:hypothetical protein
MDSVKYGPEHILTSLNYYQMGNIFIQMKEIEKGESFYSKVRMLIYLFEFERHPKAVLPTAWSGHSLIFA